MSLDVSHVFSNCDKEILQLSITHGSILINYTFKSLSWNTIYGSYSLSCNSFSFIFCAFEKCTWENVTSLNTSSKPLFFVEILSEENEDGMIE